MRILTRAALVVALLLVGTGGTTPATAVPGNPGTPSAPTVLFAEDFENGTGGTPTLLGDYTGATGTTYTASPNWSSPAQCNGIITRNSSSTHPLCGGTSANQIRQLANALGRVNGTADPLLNHAVAAYTAGNPGANQVEFASEGPVVLNAPVTNRFITFSVNVAEINCFANNSLLRFYLDDGENEIPATSSAIRPCTDPRAKNYTVAGSTYRAGTFTSDSSVLYTGTQLGIVMRNEQGSGTGNDHAYDDIRVLDVTPQLDKTFEARDGAFYVGETADLTFTITNTSELAAKDGWSFTDELPEGLEVAGAGETTCGAGTVTAAEGATEITVEDGTIAAGVASCTVTVPVTAPEPGTFTNGPDNVTTVGLLEPGTSNITFLDADPSMTLVKDGDLQDEDGDDLADVGEDIDYTFTVTNTGNTPLTGVRVDDSRVTVTPATRDVPIGGIRTFTATHTVTQADIDAGSVPNTASATGTDPLGDRVGSNEARDIVPTPDRDPRLTIDKTSDLDDENGNDVADVGEEITYSFLVRNTGNVTISGVRIDDDRIDGTTPSSATLAPGDEQTFVAAPYTVTQDDVNTRQVFNEATATGTSPLGPVRSTPDVERVETPEADPGLTIDKEGVLANDADDDGRADVGDVIDYTFVVENVGNVDLVGVSVNDARVDNISPAQVDLSPDDTQTFTGSYVVTQEDVDTGVVRNIAAASGVYESPDGDVEVDSPPDVDEVATPDRAPGLTVEKDGDLDDENGNDRADVGETITYSFEVTNTGNTTLENVRVQDERVRGITPATATLAPTDSQTFTADPYTVTQADVDAGEVLNSATARGNVPGSAETTSDPDTDEVGTVEADPGLEIEKSAELQDEDGNGTADAGEQIIYSFTVENTGNVTLSDVTVRDDRIAALVPESIDVLTPGSRVILVAAPYTVTGDDVESGEILNVATAVGTPPGGEQLESAPDEVTTPATVADDSDDGDNSADDGGSGLLPDTGSPVTWLGLLAALGLIGVGVHLVRRRGTEA